MIKFEKFRQQELEGWEERAADYGTLTARVTTQSIPALLGAIRVRVGMKVLDICTGPGFAAGAADAIGASAEGLDFAPSMVRIASGRFPGVRFWQGDALAIDAKASGYDAAICNFGIPSLLQNPKVLV